MHTTGSRIEHQFAPQATDAERQREAPYTKWTPRKTLLFVVAASCMLWGVVIYVGIQLL